jgi:hypothetical protein
MMLYYRIIILINLFFFFQVAAAKDTLRVGVYITSLFDFSIPNNEFKSDFWLWFNFKNDTLKPLETYEITSDKEYQAKLSETEKKAGWNWAAHKVSATLKHSWDVSNYPFDKQVLRIPIEEAQSDTSEMIYIADVANTRCDSSLITPGWKITDFKIKDYIRTYQTTYGDPQLKGSSYYSGVEVELKLQREHSFGLFLKLFTGLYVAFFISFLALFVQVDQVDPRFGLSVGGLFAAVGNKYIVDSNLPENATLTLIDKTHSLTFALILVTVTISAISLAFWQSDKHDLSRKVDFWGAISSLIIYIIGNIIFLSRALN